MSVLADQKSVSLNVKARQIFAGIKLEKNSKPSFQAGASFRF